MTKKPPKVHLNIHLAKPDVDDIADILKEVEPQEEPPDPIPLDIKGIQLCVLYIKPITVKLPDWVKFFAPLVSEEKFDQNTSTGAVLIVKVAERIFALTFGQGRHLVDSEKVEMDFGLKTAANLVNSDDLRGIDKSSLAGRSMQTREQTSVSAKLQNFNLDTEHDILRVITGKPDKNKYGDEYGERISGRDSLNLSVNIALDELGDFLESVIAVYNSESYKDKGFDFIDHMGEVREPSVKDALDKELLERMLDNELEKIWLAMPRIDDGNIVDFKYSASKNAQRYDDLRLLDLLENSNNPLTIPKLKSKKISCFDPEGNVVFSEQAYRWIYAEIDYQDSVCILDNGKWYKVEPNFARGINESFTSVRKYGKELPDYEDNTETGYNSRVANSDPNSFILLDRKNIWVADAKSPIEPCDLFRYKNEFIHVKRYDNCSSDMNYLFEQGFAAGKLFLESRDFREKLNEKLHGKFRMENPDQRPDASEYHIVFAIVNKPNKNELSIPFFSKIILKNIVKDLGLFGFQVSLANIPSKTKDSVKNRLPGL
uniref:Sporadically distributed protein, TIGR04141 family n=1 Tax=Candidatus Kentrum sp. LFY TaxID=2126342 RepID=A0A450ULT6_9GAMM|nr:MAG: sporadically distributed protein, TIGR04141 family [Candidatus Kentron sp. LFY]